MSSDSSDSLLITAFKRGVTRSMLNSSLLTSELSLKRSSKKFLFPLFERSMGWNATPLAHYGDISRAHQSSISHQVELKTVHWNMCYIVVLQSEAIYRTIRGWSATRFGWRATRPTNQSEQPPPSTASIAIIIRDS
jgi:hypothetical protein